MLFKRQAETSVEIPVARVFARALASLRQPVLGLCCVLSLMVVGSVGLSVPGTATAATVSEADRKRFIEARDRLMTGDMSAFNRYETQLRDYPLYGYLRYEKLRHQWRDSQPGVAAIQALNAFEREVGDTSLLRRLTRSLQRHYAKTGQWDLLLRLSQSRLAADMPCSVLRARHETSAMSGFDEAALALWVQPKTHGKRCAGVLAALEKQYTPPVSAIWERIYQSMAANKPEFAESVLHYFSVADRQQARLWIDGHDAPYERLQSNQLSQDTWLNRRIVTDLVVDWSRDDTVAAYNHWMSVRDRYRLSPEQRYDTHRALVMRGAWRRIPEAQRWLEKTNERSDDLELQQWRVRMALYNHDWQALLASVKRLPAAEQQEDHWLYWVARAHAELGRAEQARAIYLQLATLQSYYGFLSADRLGLPYAIYDEPVTPTASLLARLQSEPALIRAREFNAVGIEHEARREWNNWLSGRGTEEAAASAVLAAQWGLHDRAIFAAGRADQRRAIGLRFPVLYRTEVARASAEHGIEPAWIFGVMRRESAYIRDVRSHAGAIGLMQLMPRTASYVAELQGQKNWRGDLTDANTNIDFGTYYLRHVMNRFDGHQVMATASYNAGPHRVSSWLNEQEVDADLWIDTIPFTETRRYVRAVLAYTAIYEYHLQGEAERLSDKLQVIPGASSV